MSVCFFNSLPNGKYSKFFILAAFSNKSVSDKTLISDKNSYLLVFPVDEVEAACLSKLY